MSFDEELQNLLDQHPEVAEVKVKYKKGATLKPRAGMGTAKPKIKAGETTAVPTIIDGMSSDAQKAAEMIRNGELGGLPVDLDP